jgi:hypothetical protein
MGHYRTVSGVHAGDRGNVFLGNHQKVNGRLGGNVVKSVTKLILIDLSAGNFPGGDFAKQAIRHKNSSFLSSFKSVHFYCGYRSIQSAQHAAKNACAQILQHARLSYLHADPRTFP